MAQNKKTTRTLLPLRCGDKHRLLYGTLVCLVSNLSLASYLVKSQGTPGKRKEFVRFGGDGYALQMPRVH